MLSGYNYDPNKNCDDGSCLTNYGCTDVDSCNYDPNKTVMTVVIHI